MLLLPFMLLPPFTLLFLLPLSSTNTRPTNTGVTTMPLFFLLRHWKVEEKGEGNKGELISPLARTWIFWALAFLGHSPPGQLQLCYFVSQSLSAFPRVFDASSAKE
ncbi:hypothetical protein BDP27DRAFT_1373749 [Rhodocollybia butyracea]|uniref:Secreted protein n=1 Tax=Rhodocollybia butyracea TaxID=206335 RepID=A0A9P5P719_9AGAR|nr:hypothetical protein BDP27DRAFT_1373749 [Rhodocollybia butyracea]